ALLEPGAHEVQVRWAANGVCHSDLHVITGDAPHPLPVVLGHEAAGVVEKVGPGVETVAPGDHVCSSYIPSCGKCWYCIGGQPTMCALRDKPRWFMFDGTPRFKKDGRGLHHYLQVAGYATHSVLPEESVIPIRKDAPLDVVDASQEDPVARVHARAGRGGVDFAFEMVGTQRTMEQALLSTHRGGTCVVVGVSPAGTRLSIDPSLLLQQRILTGSSFGGGHQRTDVPMLIDLYMNGKYRLDELISRRLPLGELNRAFDLMLQGEVKRSVIVYS